MILLAGAVVLLLHVCGAARTELASAGSKSNVASFSTGCARGAACNLHTALALVAKMRGLGIAARCDTLVMQPTLAMQRRKQRRFQQQARPLGQTPRATRGVSACLGAAGRCSLVLTYP